MKINVFKFGPVSDDFVNDVLETISNTLTKAGDPDIYIEVLLFDKLDVLKSFREQEYTKVGVEVGDLFFAMHDAWMGYPRILICYELSKSLPKLAFIGGVRHEVGHAILHGSLEYYVFSPTEKLLNLANKYMLTKDFTNRIVYLTSIAVKDYEVTNYLINKGFLECQYNFIKEILKVSEDEIEAWNLSWNNYMKIIHILTIFKVYATTKPILNIDIYKREIGSLIAESLKYLPNNFREIIIALMDKLESLKGDTRSKVWNMIDIICDTLIDPILSKKIS